MTDEETIKKQLIDDITFLTGMFSAYCLDRENRQLFSFGMEKLRVYISGEWKEEEDNSLADELMRDYQ